MRDITEAQIAYDKIADKYHKKRIDGEDLNRLSEQPATFSLLGDVKGKKVLDAGCGTGIYSRILAKKGAHVYGIELSVEMLHLAKSHCGSIDIEFKQGSIDNLPYPNKNFDIVLASLVIHYLKKPEKAFKEFNRVLKNDGILIFSTTHPIIEAFTKIGKKGEITIGNYFTKGRYTWTLHNSKIKIPSYRTGFNIISRLIFNSGFVLEEIVETSLSKNKNIPTHLKKFVNMPIFLIFKCKKYKK